MEIIKEQKIAVLKSIQDDLLAQFKFAKSTETNVVAGERLKIEAAKSNLERMHSDLDRLIKWYVNVKH